jgi:molybdopterin-guanine dinucleotide biosynthesis protein A
MTVLVTRLVQQLGEAQCHHVVLVGDNAAYSDLGMPCVADAVVGRGPIAGLLGLAYYAKQRDAAFVLALACDMPNVRAGLLRRLMVEHLDMDALVPQREMWEPLCARYRVAAIIPRLEELLQANRARMMDLLDALGPTCMPLPLNPCDNEELTDWDSPLDLPDGVTYRGTRLTRAGKPQ